jgi:hypothetical protein
MNNNTLRSRNLQHGVMRLQRNAVSARMDFQLRENNLNEELHERKLDFELPDRGSP